MTEEQLKEMNSHWWWHSIKLPDGTYTPGHSGHMVTDITSRFGMPEDLTGKTVLDIGTWDGVAAFEAERRGASFVRAIDIYQNAPSKDPFKAHKPFEFVHKLLNSKVEFRYSNLEDFTLYKKVPYDLVLYYGVLYHIENPLGAIRKLSELVAPGGQVLIETAYTQTEDCVLEYIPNFEGDTTNIFRPSLSFLAKSMKEHGFSAMELIYSDGVRCTVKGFK